MFKFLHTADLHLGKTFYDHSLAEDQAAMLEDLARLLEDGSYDALVIAGDVYDRSIPAPEAVELFGKFLSRIKSIRPSPELLVIPGNHDSASRLGYGRELFSRLGIRFGVSAAECDRPVIIEKDGERCAFFLLPFLSPGSLERETPAGEEAQILRSQAALAEEAARRMEKAQRELPDLTYSVLAAHLFASGGVEAGSERVFLGNAELVSLSLFKNFNYIALGHLHRSQRAGENAWYPGSPLAYSFGEAASSKDAEKCFLSVELGKDGARVEKIPVKPLRRVTSIGGPFSRFARFADETRDPPADSPGDPELLAAADDYLEIRLSDRGITENARDILRKRFPHLLSLRQDAAFAELSSVIKTSGGSRANERRNLSADFKDFLIDLYGSEGAADLSSETDLFNTLLAEIEVEESQA